MGGSAAGQPFPPEIYVIPRTPTAATPVTIQVNYFICFTQGRSITFPAPFVIRLDLVPGGICPAVLNPIIEAPIGRLPAGTYLVEVFYGSVPLSATTFVVNPLDSIPTLSEVGLVVMALMLGLFGVMRLRRR